MEETIARLKKGKAKADAEAKTEGLKHGHQWATARAEYTELLCVCDRIDEEGKDAETLAQEIADKAGHRSFADFIDVELGLDNFTPSDAYLNGLLEGARNVWDEVKGQL